MNTHDTRLALHLADLPTEALGSATQVVFTLFWKADARWEGTDFAVSVGQV